MLEMFGKKLLFDAIRIWGGSEREKQSLQQHYITRSKCPHCIRMLMVGIEVLIKRFIQAKDRIIVTFHFGTPIEQHIPCTLLYGQKKHKDLLWSLSKMTQQGNGLPRWPIAHGLRCHARHICKYCSF